MNRVNPAIVDLREKEVETCARRSLSFESFLAKKKSVRQDKKYNTQNKKYNTQNKKYLEEYEYFEMLFKR